MLWDVCTDSVMPTESIERRFQPRTNLLGVVFIRRFDSRLPADSCTTFNVSGNGLYLATLANHYAPGVNVYVTSDFRPGSLIHFATAGIIVRVDTLENDKWGVAMHVFLPSSSAAH
jgi:hypothetical protein